MPESADLYFLVSQGVLQPLDFDPHMLGFSFSLCNLVYTLRLALYLLCNPGCDSLSCLGL